MSIFRQKTLLARLVEHPPRIEGGSVVVKPIDDQLAQLQLELGGERTELLAAALAVPYPSGLKRLIAARPDLEAVVVDRIPPGLAKAARELGIGYLDVRGQGRIVKPGFAYVAPPLPDVRRLAGAPRSSPFAPKASRVVRGLLADHERQWRLSDIAEMTALNPGNVHRALAALAEDGYVEREGDLYVVADPGSLLEAWADVSTPTRERVAIAFEGDLRHGVEDLVERLHGKVAVSGEFAAELLAPHLPAESALVHCLDITEWATVDQEDMEPPLPVSSGVPARRIVVDLPDEGVGQFGTQAGEINLVSPAQLYIDLHKQPTRGRQAAEEVRRQLLAF